MSGNRIYTIEGMTCQGCVNSLTRVVTQKLHPQHIMVRLQPGELELGSDVDPQAVARTVEAAGYRVVGQRDAPT